jgi:lipooligosaccharide transport system permease protein
VWRRHTDAFRRNWTGETGGIVLEPMVMLGGIGFGLGQFVGSVEGDVPYAEYVAPGIIASYAMFHALFENTFGTYLRMSMHRVFDSILATPVEVEDLVLGEAVWGATRSIMTSVAILAVATGLGLVASPWAVLAVPAGFLTGLVFAMMAVSITAVAPTMSVLNNVFTLLATPMFFVSGVFFPVSTLPEAVQPVVWALPLTPAVHLIRGLTLGDLGLAHLGSAGLLLAEAVAFGLLATFLMRRRLVK